MTLERIHHKWFTPAYKYPALPPRKFLFLYYILHPTLHILFEYQLLLNYLLTSRIL